MKTISVIIPAYNAGVFVAKCLNSVLAQTFEDFELIIVNDGSTDNTLEVIKEFEKKDNRIICISQENGGVSAARNTALKVAGGKYIAYVDADDTIPENAFETLLSYMKDDVDLVIGSYNVITLIKKPIYEKETVFTSDQIVDRFIEFDEVNWMPVCKLFRRSIIADNRLTYDTNITFGEDHIFNLLYAKHMTGKTVVVRDLVYNYYHIRGGLCAKYYPNMHELQKYVYLEIEKFFGGRESIPYKYRKYYVGCYLNGCVEYYIAWLGFNEAVGKVRECFEVYGDCIDDEIIREYFGDDGYGYVKSGDFKKFTSEFIKKRPKQTLWRKFRRTVRRSLEGMQRVFLKRA